MYNKVITKAKCFCKIYLDVAIHLFYPKLCCCCGDVLKNEHFLCVDCLYELPKTDFSHRRDNELEEIFYGRVDVKAAAALFYFVKESRFNELLYTLKYKNKPALGVMLGRMIASHFLNSPFVDCDCIVPVPLHPAKKKNRGYNQSEMIALGIQDTLKIPLKNELIERVSETGTQTKKNRQDSWENVKDAFQLTEAGHKIEGKNILLLDDVITTGATIEACAIPFLEKNHIFIVSAAFAVDW